MPSASGRLVVLDRAGRAGKQFALAAGAATLGRSADCDIRVLLPAAWPQHAIVAVHNNQTLVRNVGGGKTLVNGEPVSLAALQHGDVITVAGRSLRWLYDQPQPQRPLAPEPAIYREGRAGGGGGERGRRRATAVGAASASALAHAHHTLEMHHRASMPGSAGAGGKQVAIVQPQRRDASEQNDTPAPRSPARARAAASPAPSPASPGAPAPPAAERSPRPSPRLSPKNLTLQNTTKATLWIESRKSAGRRSAPPLRLAALRAAHSAARAPRTPRTPRPAPRTPRPSGRTPRASAVAKIEAPTNIDHTKQAALMLMAGHGRRSPAAPSSAAPSLLVKRRSLPAAPRRPRHSRKSSKGKSIAVLAVSESDTPLVSPPLPSPRKSALRLPGAKRDRKTESIKFDLSNLEHTHRQDDYNHSGTMEISEDDLTLHYSDTSSVTPPSPRRSIHSSHISKIMETTGSPMRSLQDSRTLTPEPPQARKSLRGSIILQKALNASGRSSRRSNKTDESWDSTMESALRTRTLSPRQSVRNLESYSIVDLVSVDSSGTVYDSVGSTRSSSVVFGTPHSTRRSRSTIEAGTLASSTPYVGRGRPASLSASSPDLTKRESSGSSGSRRSRSMTTPQNSEETKKHISINSTRISRASRSRTTLNDSELLSGSVRGPSGAGDSPRTSRSHNRLNRSLPKSPSPAKSSPRNNSQKTSPKNDSTLLSPANASSRYSSPRNASSQVVSPQNTKSRVSSLRNATSRTTSSPRNETTRLSSPRNNSTRLSSPRNETTRMSSPRNNSTRLSSPRNETTCMSSPRNNSTRLSSPRNNSTRLSSPRNNSTRLSSPRNASLRTSSSRNATPRVSPRNASSQSSPKTAGSQRSSPQKNQSTKKSFSDRRSVTNLTLDISQYSQEDGTTTPENRTSPEDTGTPVLSIQSLLDSSQSSFASQQSPRNTRLSANLKRKTIGVLHADKKKARSSLRSKSFTTSVRKSLRSLRLGKEGDSSQTEEETVTPKSEVKLVQEGVKNKHSTARKPLSKRSIIDNLNESDIVKQLFNSPVKRNLSQSMTEFSRKKLFDDDDAEVTSRPTRNTMAVCGRTPDDSLVLDRTDRFTPENFVSPLGTPGHSPNLSGVKRLYRKNTPDNDLRDVRGVKSLLRTPRTRKSVRNDLSDVTGVKEVFAMSSASDLRRVSTVKKLFKRKSPRNDLSDVRGVRDLYKRKSAANDLRNVSGVKMTFARSPKNDLTDVRGVRNLFRQRKEEEYHDVSGVERLFDDWNPQTRDAEALFDQLVGKPPIKAVYSKSFVTKRPNKKKTGRRSLHTSLDQITNNVEEWLQQELQKRLQKKADHSVNANVTRELQKLATDTVEGTEIRSSRVRNTTVQSGTNERKRSAAEVYSAHTLPIKKRSLVENSLEKSGKSILKVTLPIKKRALVHSTPVKGRNVTMNASELGRVSPISSNDFTNLAPALASKASPKSKSKRATKTVIQETQTVEAAESPKPKGRTKAKVGDTVSPKQKRVTRARVERPEPAPKTRKQTGNEEVKPTSPKAKRNAKQAVVKTSPISPKTRGRETNNRTDSVAPEPRRTRNNTFGIKNVQNEDKVAKPTGRRGRKTVENKEKSVDVVPSPKKTRASRAKPKPETEVTNTKKRRKSLVITKKPPMLSPKPASRATRRNQKIAEDSSQASQPVQRKTSRKQKDETIANKPKSPKQTRAKLVVSKPSPKLNPQTKKSASSTDKESPVKRSRRTANVESQKEPKRGGRRVNSSPVKSPPVRRGRKAADSPQKSPANKVRKIEEKQDSEPPAKRGRKAKNTVEIPPPSPKRTRGKNISQESLPKTSRRNKTELAESQTQKSRKRKSNEDIDVPAKIPKTEPRTRGRKTVEASAETKKTPAKQSKAEAAKKSPTKAVAKTKKTEKEKPASPKESNVSRSKRQAADVQNRTSRTQKSAKGKEAAKKSPEKPAQRNTRGKKAVVEAPPPPVSGRGKRSAKVVTSPAKAVTNTRSRRR